MYLKLLPLKTTHDGGAVEDMVFYLNIKINVRIT